MHTKAVIASLLLAAVGTQAAPGLDARQVTSIPLSVYNGDNCGGPVVTTVNVPTTGECFAFSPIVSGQTDSAQLIVPGSLPAGCVLTLFNTNNCRTSGQPAPNFVDIRQVQNSCRTFGAGNPLDPFIRAARTSGTCT